MRPLSQRLQLLRARMSDTGRLAVTDALILGKAIELAKRYEGAPVGELFVSNHDVRDIALADADGQFMVMSHLAGQRVRILLDTDPNPHQ